MLRGGLRPWSRKGPDHGAGVDPSLLNLAIKLSLPFLFLRTELELQLPLLAALFARQFSSMITSLILPSGELRIRLPLPLPFLFLMNEKCNHLWQHGRTSPANHLYEGTVICFTHVQGTNSCTIHHTIVAHTSFRLENYVARNHRIVYTQHYTYIITCKSISGIGFFCVVVLGKKAHETSASWNDMLLSATLRSVCASSLDTEDRRQQCTISCGI